MARDGELLVLLPLAVLLICLQRSDLFFAQCGASSRLEFVAPLDCPKGLVLMGQ